MKLYFKPKANISLRPEKNRNIRQGKSCIMILSRRAVLCRSEKIDLNSSRRKKNIRKIHFFWLPLFFCLQVFSANAQEAVTGPQFRNATLGSVDILSSHLMLFQAQSKYNKILNNYSFTGHIAPAKLEINDGSIQEGSIARYLVNVGVGYGTIDKFGFYFGAQEDFVSVRGGDNVKSDVFQGLAFFGISFFGFQLDMGYMVDQGFDLDGNLEFAKKTSQIVSSDETELSSTADKRIYSIYHKSGIYISTVFSKINYSDKSRSLSDFRFNVQPLKRYLPKAYGLPFLDVIGYTPFSSYYTKYKDLYNTVVSSEPFSANKTNYDLSLGSDNLFGNEKRGIRASATLQAYPKTSFRKMELAYNYFRNEKRQIFGARTQVFMKDNVPNISFDAFATLTVEKKWFTTSLSYSYNSPDNITFIPLPNLHVIGIQFIFGKRETARAVVPYAASLLMDAEPVAKK